MTSSQPIYNTVKFVDLITEISCSLLGSTVNYVTTRALEDETETNLKNKQGNEINFVHFVPNAVSK